MTLAVCAKDVKFYNWAHITFLGSYETSPTDSVFVKTLSWSSDGKEILIIKNKGDPVIAKAPKKSAANLLDNCSNVAVGNNVSTGCFSNTNPNLIAFGFECGDVTAYDMENRNVVRYKKLPSAIQNIDYSSDDQHLIAGCIDGHIYLYGTKYKLTASFIVPNCQTLSTCTFSSHAANILLGASKDGAVCVWDIETSNKMFYNKNHSSRVTDAAFRDETLATVGTDGNFCICDFRVSNQAVIKYDLDGALSSLAYINDYELAISTYNQLRCYDARNMYSAIHTSLLNNGGNIRKISYSDNLLTEAERSSIYQHSSQFLWSQAKRTENDNLSASGDFSMFSDNNTLTSPASMNLKESIDINASSSSQETALTPDQQHSQQEIARIAEETAKQISAEFSEHLANAFCALRMNASKKFIYLEDKINDSWNNFIDYLKCSGAASLGVIEKTSGVGCGDAVSEEDEEDDTQ